MNDMNIYKNIEEYSPNKKRKTLIVSVLLLICLAIKNLIQ